PRRGSGTIAPRGREAFPRALSGETGCPRRGRVPAGRLSAGAASLPGSRADVARRLGEGGIDVSPAATPEGGDLGVAGQALRKLGQEGPGRRLAEEVGSPAGRGKESGAAEAKVTVCCPRFVNLAAYVRTKAAGASSREEGHAPARPRPGARSARRSRWPSYSI